MPTTLRNTDILFNDGTTQSTAATGVPSSFSAVGSVLWLVNWSTSNLFPGNTVAGSSLLYVTGGTKNGTQFLLEGTPPLAVTYSQTNQMGGTKNGNLGAFQPSNTSTLSGTWRVLSAAVSRTSVYDSSYTQTSISYMNMLVQRIS